MKRLILIVLAIFAFSVASYGTLPGPPMLVECPKCGHEKSLMTLVSANTFGAKLWSDSYQWAPMHPRLSKVQKCPDCGAYFLLYKAKDRSSDNDDNSYSSDTGRLTYAEMKEALSLLDDETLTENDIDNIRFEFLCRYNDAFRNGEYSYKPDENTERTEEDINLHKENLMALIALRDETDTAQIPFIAELYREAGEFDKCLSLLKAYTPESEFMESFIGNMRQKAEEKDSMVFLVY